MMSHPVLLHKCFTSIEYAQAINIEPPYAGCDTLALCLSSPALHLQRCSCMAYRRMQILCHTSAPSLTLTNHRMTAPCAESRISGEIVEKSMHEPVVVRTLPFLITCHSVLRRWLFRSQKTITTSIHHGSFCGKQLA